jgi:hypothetical protein
VALQSWEGLEIDGLPPAHGAGSAEEWMSKFHEGLNTIKSWFEKYSSVDHSVFGDTTKFLLFGKGNKYDRQEATIKKNGKDQKVSGNFSGWEIALADAGKTMQEFRFHREPDYSLINNGPLIKAPERIHFGLPLTFRKGESRVTFEGATHNRSASPIHIRVVEINDACHPLYIRMDSPLLAINETLKNNQLNPGTLNILDVFWTELCKIPGCSVNWTDVK